MSDILREEFNRLSERVDSLEKEVAFLKSRLQGENALIKSTANDVLTFEKNDSNSDPVIDFVDAHSRLRANQNRIVSGIAQKIIGYDANKIAHKHIKLTYVFDGNSYVAYTVVDMDDEKWNLFSKPATVDVFIDGGDYGYSHFNIDDEAIDLVAHINDGQNWKKQFDEERKLYYFSVQEISVNANRPVEIVQKNDAPKQSLEKVIGTKWMGIFASILIFVAFVMFGASIYSMLTNLHKAIILLIISAVFTAVGLLRVKNTDNPSAIWYIVSGCGLGGFYITFLLMNLQFYLIGEWILLALLLIWTVCMIAISRKFSIIFAYVCYAGVLVSTILCNAKWDNSIIGLVFYAIAVVALVATNYEEDYCKNYFWSAQFPFVFLYFKTQNGNAAYYFILWALVLITVLIQAHVFDFDEKKDTDIAFYLVNNIFSFACFYFIKEELSGENMIPSYITDTLLLLSCAAVTLNNYLKFKGSKGYYLVTYYITLLVVPFLSFGSGYDKYIGLALFIVPMLIFGYVKENVHFMYPPLAYLMLYLFVNPQETKEVITYAVAALCVAFLIYTLFSRYSVIIKYYLVVFVSIALPWMCYGKRWFNAGIMYALFAIVAIIMITPAFANEEQEGAISKLIAFAYNALLMMSGIIIVWTYKENIWIMDNEFYGTEKLYGVILTLFVVALYAFNLNFKRLSDLGIPDYISGWMIGFGYTMLLISVLSRLEAVNYVISIFLVITSIIFISLGFFIDVKSIRLYGLVMSILCVIKLVFFDIQYDSSAWYPVGLFACGGLCLLICWIYNRIEKMGVADKN